MIKKRLWLVGMFVLCAALAVPAQVRPVQPTSRVIFFTGTVPSDLGTPAGLRLRLYPEAIGGAQVFEEIQPVTLSEARFSVYIGDTMDGGLPAYLFALYPSLWIGVAPGSPSDAEDFGARVPITTAGYAQTLVPGAQIIGAQFYTPILHAINTGNFGLDYAIVGQVTTSYGAAISGLASAPGAGRPSDLSAPGGPRPPWDCGTDGQPVGVCGVTTVPSGTGVFGRNSAASGMASYGLRGETGSPSAAGVLARSADGAATNVGLRVVGSGTATGGFRMSMGASQIDHPLDPANKYLEHAFVGSPDMMNVYNGNILLDANGAAWVTLPEWFETLHRDFRYQLTAVGTPGPTLHIAQEIANDRFQIAGGPPGGKVSWQVTGIRKDPFAEKYRMAVEAEKPPHEKGHYRHTEFYGPPESAPARRPD